MQSIKIKNFRGLSTYLDSSDIGLEYFSLFKNILVYPGYIESADISTKDIEINLEDSEKIINAEYVFIDEDPYKNKFENNQLINTYQPNIQKVLLLITKKDNKYKFYINGIKNEFEHISDIEQEPLIINENSSIVKIFFKEKSYYITKLNRYRFIYSDTIPQYLNQNYAVLPLINFYDINNKIFDFELLNISGNYIVDARLRIKSEWIWNYLGYNFIMKAYELYYIDNETNQEIIIDYPGENGYLNAFKGKIIYSDGIEIIELDGYLFHDIHKEKGWITNFDEIFNKYDIPIFIEKQFNTTEGIKHIPEFNGLKFRFIQKEKESLLENEIFKIDLSKMQILDNSYLFDGTSIIEMVTTIETMNGEFVYAYEKLPQSPSTFSIKSKIKDNAIELLPKDTIGINLYLGYKEKNDQKELITYNYQQVLNIPLVISKRKSPINFFNKLSPNGIYLFQTIGINFDPNNYVLLDGFDYYKTINGVSFAIKNNVMYYPAVGFGKILNNIFYNSNYVPGVKPFFITEISNKIAVFESEKDKLTLLDYSPIESQLLFFPAGSFQHKIKSYKDIVETAEGLIINTYDGIFILSTNGRISISNVIMDVIRRNYNNSLIFYNEINRELYYICDEGVYLYKFETQSWSNLSRLSKNKVEKIFTNYKDKLFAIINIDGRKQIKEIYYIKENIIGEIGYKNVNLNEITTYKVVNSIAFDMIGSVECLNKQKIFNKRDCDLIHNHIENRIPNKYFDINIKFNGIIYNIEIFFDIFSYKIN